MTEFFHTQEQESISDHALFTAAFEAQRKFSEQQYATHTDALRETLPDIEQLQDMVTEAGLLNKQTSLIGFDIIVPRLAREESTGIESLDPVRLDITGEPLSEHPPVEGKFYGFSQVVRKTEEGFEVDLHYRVALKEDFMQGAFVGSLCAQGSVSSSHLEFEDDTRRKNIATALDTLASKTVDDTAKVAVAYLYDLLSPTDDESAYSQYRLQQIGQTIRDLETAQGKVDLQFRDAIIDLVTARLGVEEGSYFNIEAPDGFFWSGNPESPYAITNDIHGSFTSQGIGFIPYYHPTADKIDVHKNIHTLAVAISVRANGRNTYCYIPFEKMHRLEPEVDS